MPRVTRRSSGADQAASTTLTTNVHPSTVTIDARCIPMDVLREYLPNGNRIFEGPIDFVDMPLDDIGSLFLNNKDVDETVRRNLHELPPPLSHRREAKDMKQPTTLFNRKSTTEYTN